MDRGAWQATVHGVTKSWHNWATKQSKAKRLPWWSNDKESACQCGRPKFDPWFWKISWRRAWLLTPVFLPRSLDRSACRATVRGVAKSQTQLSDSHFQWLRIPCQCRGHWFNLCSKKIPYATKQLRTCITNTDALDLEPVLQNKRSHYNKNPMHSKEE